MNISNDDDSEGPIMMRNVSDSFHGLCQLVSTLLKLSADAWHFLVLSLWPSPALAAEELFLRKQLALYEERQIKPRWANHAVRRATATAHLDTRDLYALAPPGIPLVLAVEIQARSLHHERHIGLEQSQLSTNRTFSLLP
jgi:hypothetical protein